MSKHDDLLTQGPHEAPEPETAEQRSKRTGWGAAGGGIAAGGVALAKLGALAKVAVWVFAFDALNNGWRMGAWAGIVAVLALIGLVVVLRLRRRP